ncbi:hypothetical protein COO72_09860 [Bifidobacterium callitrichos]|nr:hypothetical protein COO72_09860 [Bifidobacterium callitrichos]
MMYLSDAPAWGSCARQADFWGLRLIAQSVSSALLFVCGGGRGHGRRDGVFTDQPVDKDFADAKTVIASGYSALSL